MAGPLQQFDIVRLAEVKIGRIDVSFTNSSLWMVIACVAAVALLTLSVRSRDLVPGRWQSVSEMLYELVAGMVKSNVGAAGRPYFPFIFTLFIFVLFGNMLGMIPGSFTYTSHIAVTFALAAVVFIGVTVIGFAKHGLHFFHFFFPHGAPIFLAPIIIPIEVVSYLSRPISLSVRLFANMTVGHTMLKVIGGFVAPLSIFGVVPLALLVGITLLEFGIAFLQAYIFTILTCLYLNDALHMH